MTALRAIWVTWKMHRLEILMCTALLAILSISAVVTTGQLRAALPAAGCRTLGMEDPDPACDRELRSYTATDDQANLVLGVLAVVPAFVGLALGVPVVAQELETRTAHTAWSLVGHRSRWLLARGLPMAALLVAGMALLGAAAAELGGVRALAFDRGPDLDTLGNQGLPLVGRAVMAFGIGMLVGSMIGRSLPALLVAGLVMVAWYGLGAPAVRAAQYESHYIWTTYDDRDRLGLGGLHYDHGNGDWYRSPEGSYVSWRQWVTERCGPIPEDALRAMERYADPSTYDLEPATAQCLDRNPIPEDYEPAVRLVPAAAFGDFERTETLATLAVGGLAIGLTFPVVARRRPE